GRISMEGSPEAVMDYYNALLANHQSQVIQQNSTADGKTQIVSGTGEATVREISLTDQTGGQIDVIEVGQTVCLQIVVRANTLIENLVLGYGIKDRLGQIIYGTNTYFQRQVIHNV